MDIENRTPILTARNLLAAELDERIATETRSNT
jgi:hypothetical protein